MVYVFVCTVVVSHFSVDDFVDAQCADGLNGFVVTSLFAVSISIVVVISESGRCGVVGDVIVDIFVVVVSIV
jgi:hypothetical protein